MIRITTRKALKFILLFMLTQTAITGNAQTDPIESLITLNKHLQGTSMYYNVTYYYEEDDSAGVVRDTLSGMIKCNEGRTWMQLGSMKKISNEYYFMLIDTANMEMYVSNPQPLTMQYATSELTNHKFVSAYVDTMTADDSSDCVIIKIQFKESAQYNDYEVIYKPSSFEMVSLSYSMKKESDTTNWVGSTLPEIRLKIAFSSLSASDEDIYNTKQYFIRKNGVLALQPAYAGYQLIDMTGGN